MRVHGTLTKWNDERGFGFISPAQPGEEVFVHVSAFPRDGERPRLNELISYETETGPNGRLRAVRVMRPGQRSASRRSRATRRSDQSSNPVVAALSVLAMAAIGVYAVSQTVIPERSHSVAPTVISSPAAMAPSASLEHFSCDGRRMCSQMTSCAEATYFIQHCPNTQMDGDFDGRPCEDECSVRRDEF